MQLYEMQVNKTAITRAAAVRIPKGVIGAVVRFSFSPEWEGLSKTVVFRAGDVSKDILDVKEFAVIPAECTQEIGQLLEVGVYGVDGENTVAIPTMWEAIGRITEAADPAGDTSTDPALPVWAQLQERIRMLEETGVSQKDIEDAIKAYFDGNPPTGQKTAQGGEIYNYYTEKVYTGDNPPKEYPGNTAAKGAFAQNFGTHADGEYSSASGWNSTASGGISNASGRETLASGYASATEGWLTKATNSCAHAGGKETEATGANSFSHGLKAKATNSNAVATGEGAEASGYCANASGYMTKASGTCASASGRETEAQQYASSAMGRGTIATARNQSVRGAYNIPDTVDANGNGEFAEIVGGGSNANSRANIYTLDWNGNGWFKGHVYVGNVGTERNRLAMKSEVPTVYPWARALNKPSYTANEVGAAPAGIVHSAIRIDNGTDDDLMDSIVGIFNAMANDTVRFISVTFGAEHPVLGGAAYLFTIYRRIAGYGFIEAKSYDREQGKIVRNLSAGSWDEWEHENPPMMPNVEYRTTERSGGLPVYTKTFGVQPNVTTTFGIGEYDHGITGFKYLCRAEARTENNVLPLITNERTVCIAAVTGTKVKIAATKQDFTDYTSITLWYTKN